jgi:hypothetical protein
VEEGESKERGMRQYYVFRKSDCAILTNDGFKVADMRLAKFMYFTEAVEIVKETDGLQWECWGTR